jgi:electron transport complex protein RnfG
MAVYGLKLGLVCLVATGLLAIVNSITLPKIKLQADEELEESLKEVLAQGEKFEAVKKGDEIIYYRAFDKEGNFLGAAFKVSAKGYSSIIETMVGMTKDGTINAIKVLNHNETPGLGSRITEVKKDNTILDVISGKKSGAVKKPWFQEQFSNKKIAEVSNIQVITGATISSKAVIDSVNKKTQEIRELLRNKE